MEYATPFSKKGIFRGYIKYGAFTYMAYYYTRYRLFAPSHEHGHGHDSHGHHDEAHGNHASHHAGHGDTHHKAHDESHEHHAKHEAAHGEKHGH